MTPETVLMYATLITAVLQNINIDTLTTTLGKSFITDLYWVL